MRVTILLAVSLMVWLPSIVGAQTHYCDTAVVTSGTGTAGQTMELKFCHPLLDSNNQPTTLTGFAFYDNGVRRVINLTQGTKSAISGLWEFTGSYVVPNQAGLHTLELAAINAIGEGPKAGPFALTVSGTPASPAAGSNFRAR